MQTKDTEIISLSDKNKSVDELVDIMKERVSNLQEGKIIFQTEVGAWGILSKKLNKGEL